MVSETKLDYTRFIEAHNKWCNDQKVKILHPMTTMMREFGIEYKRLNRNGNQEFIVDIIDQRAFMFACLKYGL